MTRAEQAEMERAIEAGLDEADRIVEDMFEDVPDEFWFDTVFSLWLTMTQFLIEMGWSSEELQLEVAKTEAHQTTQGPIQ